MVRAGESWRFAGGRAHSTRGISGESAEDKKQSGRRHGLSGHSAPAGPRDHGLPPDRYCAEVRSHLS